MSYEEKLERISDLMSNPNLILEIENCVSPYSIIFNVDSLYYDFEDYYMAVGFFDEESAIFNFSMETVPQYISQMNIDRNKFDITDEELTIITAIYLSKELKKIWVRKKGMNYADEYSRDKENIERYGTKTRAYNRGYDKYQIDNSPSTFEFSEYVCEYLQNNSKSR